MPIQTGQEAADGQCGQPQQSCHTEIYPPDSMEKAFLEEQLDGQAMELAYLWVLGCQIGELQIVTSSQRQQFVVRF